MIRDLAAEFCEKLRANISDMARKLHKLKVKTMRDY